MCSAKFNKNIFFISFCDSKECYTRKIFHCGVVSDQINVTINHSSQNDKIGEAGGNRWIVQKICLPSLSILVVWQQTINKQMQQ